MVSSVNLLQGFTKPQSYPTDVCSMVNQLSMGPGVPICEPILDLLCSRTSPKQHEKPDSLLTLRPASGPFWISSFTSTCSSYLLSSEPSSPSFTIAEVAKYKSKPTIYCPDVSTFSGVAEHRCRCPVPPLPATYCRRDHTTRRLHPLVSALGMPGPRPVHDDPQQTVSRRSSPLYRIRMHGRRTLSP